jgi:hypothetical protein
MSLFAAKSATNYSRWQQLGLTYKQEVAGSSPAPPIVVVEKTACPSEKLAISSALL